MIRFTTYSGSTYEIRNGEVRRLNEGYGKRADGEWVMLLNAPVIEVGQSAILVLDSLSPYGPDDYGTPPEEADIYTTRVTSPVTWMEEFDG